MTSLKDQVAKLIDGAKVSMIGSVDECGFPNLKAMLPPRKREGLTKIYFSTNTSSIRVRQFRENSKGCVYFFDEASFRGAMLVGLVEILEDEASKEMTWRPGDRLYYPLGVSDPDYCVLCFTINYGRYYGGNLESESFIL